MRETVIHVPQRLSRFSCLFVIFYVAVTAEGYDEPSTDRQHQPQQLPPCAACKVLTSSFERGIERTRRERFDGGDSAWEEERLGSYGESEIRLIEIQERLCKDVADTAVAQCHALADQLEDVMEDWWFHRRRHRQQQQQQQQTDIFDYVCVRRTERCCPENHFGPLCTPCPGYPDRICENNGKCKGAGTRKGNGGCVCDHGYRGDDCSECATGFYASYKDENKLLCTVCHEACDGACHGPGPNNCAKCMDGWEMMTDNNGGGGGCVDIDECVNSRVNCPGNQFCVNKDGDFACLSCDKACNGCTGDGPDMCTNCARDYHKKDNLCINSDILGRRKQENIARYATYFGLCVATCIIFQRNIYIASVIGLLVGLYISVSEYMIANSNVQDTTANLDILGPA